MMSSDAFDGRSTPLEASHRSRMSLQSFAILCSLDNTMDRNQSVVTLIREQPNGQKPNCRDVDLGPTEALEG